MGQVVPKLFLGRAIAGFPESKCARDCRRHDVRIRDGIESHEPCAVLEPVRDGSGALGRERRLARAAGTGQGYEAARRDDDPAMSASSASRPTKLVRRGGRWVAETESVRGGGKADGNPAISSW